MSLKWNTPASTLERELDNCQICGGYRGGVPGNENRIEGLIVCDYCTARRPPMPTGLVSATTVAVYTFGLMEQLILLTRKLNDPSADVGTPHEIIGRMQKLLSEVGQLPAAAPGMPWFPVDERLPERLTQLLVSTKNGDVKESNGTAVRELVRAAQRDKEDCFYTYWTTMPTCPQAAADQRASDTMLHTKGKETK